MDYNYNLNNYNTPDNAQKFVGDTLLFKSRLYFYWRTIKLVWKTFRIIKNGKFDDIAWSEASFYSLRSIEGCGGKIEVDGLDNISKSEKPVVFIGNHMSLIETFALPGMICPKREVSFVVKDSLTKYPCFGLVIRNTQPIVVGRHNPAEDFKIVMKEGAEMLKNGRSIIVFPQSTRSSKFKPEEFNSIGIKLAKKAGVDVQPIALKTDFWDNSSKFKEFSGIDRTKKIHFSFGEPISVEGNGKEAHQRVIDYIQSKLENWNKQKNQ